MNKEDVAKDLASVRKTGQTNMLDRMAVVSILESLDCYDSAEYVACHKSEYMDLLELSSKY